MNVSYLIAVVVKVDHALKKFHVLTRSTDHLCLTTVASRGDTFVFVFQFVILNGRKCTKTLACNSDTMNNYYIQNVTSMKNYFLCQIVEKASFEVAIFKAGELVWFDWVCFLLFNS